MKKIFIILFCWLLNSQLSFTAGVSEPHAKAEAKRERMSIFGPKGYAKVIKEGKLDGPLTPDFSLALKKILENAELDILDNIPLRTYLSEFNLYPKDKIYSKDPVTELRAAIVKRRKEKLRSRVKIARTTKEDFELYNKDEKEYLKYLKKCKNKKGEKEEISKHLGSLGHVRDLTGLIHEYTCLSNQEWQKQNSYEDWVQKNNELFEAIVIGDIKAIKELLDNGAYVNARDTSDYTVIMRVALSYLSNPERIDIIKLFLDAGADINAKKGKGSNHIGFTALHFAAAHKDQYDVVKFLISSGADINAADAQGDTPLDVTIENKNKNIAILLRKAGAKSNKYSIESLNKIAPIS